MQRPISNLTLRPALIIFSSPCLLFDRRLVHRKLRRDDALLHYFLGSYTVCNLLNEHFLSARKTCQSQLFASSIILSQLTVRVSVPPFTHRIQDALVGIPPARVPYPLHCLWLKTGVIVCSEEA